MRRLVALWLAVAVSLGASLAFGCKRELVEVQSGTQVVCTYGEVVSEDVQTLKVPSGEVARYSVKTTTVTCPRHQKLADLYAQAQDALRKGDTKTAAKKLAEVVAADPAYRRAAEQAEEIAAGQRPAPDTDPVEEDATAGTPSAGSGGSSGGGGGGGRPDGSGEPAGPAINLTRYVPDSIPGFTAFAIMSDPLSLSRQYWPVGGGDVGSLVIAADQYKDVSHAQRMMVSTVQRPYPSSAEEVSVSGLSGYFGTDGHRYAVVAFRDGAVVVVFEMYSKSNQPVALKDELLAVAGVVF